MSSCILSQRMMNSETHTSVPFFTCPLCLKKYTTRKSQIRHISYCKKARKESRTRKRACIACTKAKTHCDRPEEQRQPRRELIDDGVSPQCTRCNRKAILCQYEKRVTESNSDDSSAARFQDQEDSQVVVSDTQPDLSSIQSHQPPGYTMEQQSMNILALTNSTPDMWNLQDLESTLTQNKASNIGTSRASLPSADGQLSIGIPSPIFHDNNDAVSAGGLDFSFVDSVGTTSATDALMMNSLESFNLNAFQPAAFKAFQPRIEQGLQLSLSTCFVLCTLRSYPCMLLPGTISPPFIHAQFLADRANNNFGHASTPRPLAICQAIVQMFSAKNKDNCVFIWKTIRIEQERLAAEYLRYNQTETIAALQAITIYFLLRVAETDESATDFDIPLIKTMRKISKHATTLRIRFMDQPLRHRMTWETWVLAESLRRTIITIFLVDLFFDITPGLLPAQCDGSEFSRMTLPSTRCLWNSSTRSEWEREFTLQHKNLDNGRHLTYGDLKESHLNADKEGFRRQLHNWLGQVDEFGSLIIAAANTHGGTVFRH